MLRNNCLFWLGLVLCLGAGPAALAQQPLPDSTVRLITASPLVGPVIDRQEKATYGLFIYYAADSFVEATIEQSLTPDSSLTLHTRLRDGRTVRRPFSAAELTAVRTAIAARQQLAPRPQLERNRLVPSLRHTARWAHVELRDGTEFDGELLARYRKHLELLVADSGLVVVERDSLTRFTSHAPPRRLTTRFAVGNGYRLVLAPTARNLRRGEAYLQQLDGIVLGTGYGFTDYFSVGVLFSALPPLPPSSQFLLVVPKLSVRLSEQWHVGGGLMYARVPKLDEEFSAIRTGIGYGIVTYGSPDDNVSVGLGYAISKTGIDNTPVLHYGAQKRISRGWALVSDNYLLINSEPGTLGLFGARFAARRMSAGLGGAYALPFRGTEDAFILLPVYIDFAYRFGKGTRLAAY
ncbi:MAG: hypothetical protein H7Z21_01945 [Hymenobacter sp.]|nr:hypothetical protein [Hymenobacter sp.]